MSILDETLAAMDRADTETALTYARSQFDSSGALPRSDDVAVATGMRALTALCEAYGLDTDEVTAMAATRGTLQFESVMLAFRRDAHPSQRGFLAGLVAGGIMTGLRIGLMVADQQSKGA